MIFKNFLLSELEEPYTLHYKSASVHANYNNGGRRYITINPKRSMGGCQLKFPYAKYLFQVDYWKKYQQWIPDEYEVDHINNDSTDDRLDNYQLITGSQNMQKMNNFRGRAMYVVVCASCGLQHVVRKPNTDDHMSKSGSHAMCCSISCLGNIRGGDIRIDGNTRSWVKNNQIQYEIRKHWFDYEDWYGEFYPYTEIVSVRSRELMGYAGIDSLRSRLPKELKHDAEHELLAPIDRVLVIRDYINDEKPIDVIADFLGLDYRTVNKYIIRYGISVPWRDVQKERLLQIEAMLRDGTSIGEVARLFGMSRATIDYHSKRLGLRS